MKVFLPVTVKCFQPGKEEEAAFIAVDFIGMFFPSETGGTEIITKDGEHRKVRDDFEKISKLLEVVETYENMCKFADILR